MKPTVEHGEIKLWLVSPEPRPPHPRLASSWYGRNHNTFTRNGVMKHGKTMKQRLYTWELGFRKCRGLQGSNKKRNEA
jgi:hypothetical protein